MMPRAVTRPAGCRTAALRWPLPGVSPYRSPSAAWGRATKRRLEGTREDLSRPATALGVTGAARAPPIGVRRSAGPATASIPTGSRPSCRSASCSKTVPMTERRRRTFGSTAIQPAIEDARGGLGERSYRTVFSRLGRAERARRLTSARERERASRSCNDWSAASGHDDHPCGSPRPAAVAIATSRRKARVASDDAVDDARRPTRVVQRRLRPRVTRSRSRRRPR